MRYRIGDYVWIKKNLQKEKLYGNYYWITKMNSFLGSVVKIDWVYLDGYKTSELPDCRVTEEMIEKKATRKEYEHSKIEKEI